MRRSRTLRRLLAAAVATAAGLTLATPAAAPALVVGIADQKPDMFGDARFQALGLGDARVNVGWDVLSSRWQTAELSAWLDAARAAGVQPLVSFGHSRTPGLRRVLPTPGRFRTELRRIRARWPWLRTFAVWNEPNHCGEPTCHRAPLVAAYYDALRAECRGCRLLASELLDMPNMESWVREFRRHVRSEPRLWGLHNYLDVNRRRTTGTSRLLKVTHGQVWLTETGGIVRRRNRSRVTFPESPRHAAAATRWLFERLVPMSPRITRVYLYHWNASSALDSWDSALFDHLGRARPAFAVLTRAVVRARARAASRADRARR